MAATEYRRRERFLPFSRPTLGEEEKTEVLDSLNSGWITTGPKVVRFEEMFKERLGVNSAVSVNSGTAGLHVAVAALELGPEDEVIVPSITWAATSNVVELCGARTVFADVDPDTICMDPDDTAARITGRTRAIIPVHYAGQPADLGRFRSMTAGGNIALIQDAAHALGASYDGREIGSSGETCVFSFHPTKNITAGEGGMVTLNNEDIAERLRLLRFHGVSREARNRSGTGALAYDVILPGWKYNMLDIQAALGIHQLKKLDSMNARRRELAERYDLLLADVPEITPLGRVKYPATHSWHIYVVKLSTEAVGLDRDAFASALAEENIGTGLHFPPLHLSSYYRRKYGYEPGSLPNAEDAGKRIFSLPLFPLMTEEDQDDVVMALRKVIADNHR